MTGVGCGCIKFLSQGWESWWHTHSPAARTFAWKEAVSVVHFVQNTFMHCSLAPGSLMTAQTYEPSVTLPVPLGSAEKYSNIPRDEAIALLKQSDTVLVPV
jgi:hypothetical protein